MIGISPLHDPHQVAQMLNIVPLPREARANWPNSEPLRARTLELLVRVPIALGGGITLSGSEREVRLLQEKIDNSPKKVSRRVRLVQVTVLV